MAKIVVGLSGGVDSAVSALLLKRAGHEVIGLFMKNWEETSREGICQSARDYEDVGHICDQIGIPYYAVNFVEEYWDQVFCIFIEELKMGHTPNPDILCNREIKFKLFFQKAMDLGADYLATGHYARSEGGVLLKGLDRTKDQSYFLYTLKKEILEKVLFPIGHLEKTEVRAIARAANLPVHDKKDSTGICFIGKRNFKQFISQYIPYQPGPFETLEGEVIGQHDGVAYYTIGQRKGLGIGGPGDAWFVVQKDIPRNAVILAQGKETPALFAKGLVANEVNFEVQRTACRAKIRYRQEDQPCTIQRLETGKIEVSFDQPQRAVTPRQAIVFYQGERCLGGALIEKAF